MGNQKKTPSIQKSKKISRIPVGFADNGMLPLTVDGVPQYSQVRNELSDTTLSRLIERIKSL